MSREKRWLQSFCLCWYNEAVKMPGNSIRRMLCMRTKPMAHSFIVIATLLAAKPATNVFDWTGFWTTVIATAIGGFLGGFIALFSTIYQLRRTAKDAQRERDEERREREKEQIAAQEQERLDALKLLATDLRMTATMAGIYGDNLKVGYFGSDTHKVWARMQLQTLSAAERYLHTVPPFVYEAVIKAGTRTTRYNTIADIQNAFQTNEPAYQLHTVSGLAEAARIAQFQAAEYLETFIDGQAMEPAASKASHTLTVSLLLRGSSCGSYNPTTGIIDRTLKNMAFVVKDENLLELGVGELGNGEAGPEEDSLSCQYKVEIKDIHTSRVYLILLGEAGWKYYYESEYGGVAYSYAHMEKLNWHVSLELNMGLTIPGERIVKAANR
jgi:hypothetical protein